MTWVSKIFAVGEVLTAAMMNNEHDNVTAQANGDIGAPKQQTAGIQDNAITGAKLNLAYVSSSFTSDIGSFVYTFPEGTYYCDIEHLGGIDNTIEYLIEGSWRSIGITGFFVVSSGSLRFFSPTAQTATIRYNIY